MQIQNKPNLYSSLFKGRMAIFLSGFSMLMVQVVLLRELSSLFVVNELIVGVFLSFWMLFTGSGAFVARYIKGFRWSHAGLLPLLSGLAALFSLWVLYLARHLLSGDISPGVSDWLLITALITFVFCFPSGVMFTWFSAALSYHYDERQTERVYISEQWGSLIAGVLFYLLPALWLNAFSAVTILVVLNLLMALYLAAPVRSGFVRAFSLVALLGVLVLYFLPQYKVARQMIAGNSEVEKTFFSPYGSINVFAEADDAEYFANGRFVSGDMVSRHLEELLHPAMLLHPDPQHVLLINVDPGVTSEALKYDGLVVDFVSPDEARISLEKKLLASDADGLRRVNFVNADPLRYLRRLDKPFYDVVLLGGGIPYNLASTRFYTTDFFSLVSEHLNPGGLFVTGGIEYAASWSDTRRDILMVLEQTVSEIFPFLRMWGGDQVFFIASNEKITTAWWENHQEVIAGNQFLNETFFPDYMLEAREAEIKGIVESQVRLNTRVRPVLFQLALHDMSDFWDIELYWFVLVIGVLLIVGLIFFRDSGRGVFLSGLVLGGMQVVLLLYWQLVVGNLFRATGLLFSFFMAGLAIGAILGHRNFWFFQPRYFPVLLIGLSLLSIVAVPLLDSAGHSFIFPVIVFLLVLAFAILGGAVFVAGITLHRGVYQQSAASVYLADVAGGAIGSFLSAIFLVPFAGLVNAGYLMGMVVLIAGLLMLKRF